MVAPPSTTRRLKPNCYSLTARRAIAQTEPPGLRMVSRDCGRLDSWVRLSNLMANSRQAGKPDLRGGYSMQYRDFGRTGWRVGEIGYGMWGLAGWTGSDDAGTDAALERAVALGCNF